jgi:hypothetical protein
MEKIRIGDPGKNSGSATLLQYTRICCGTSVVSHHCKKYERIQRTVKILVLQLQRFVDFLIRRWRIFHYFSTVPGNVPESDSHHFTF